MFSYSNEIDALKGLEDISVVESRLKNNMKLSFGGNEDKATIVDRIGMSNLFIANIDGKPFISDSSAAFISPRSELKRFTSKGLFNALSGNDATSENISLYNYIFSLKDKLPLFRQTGSSESKGVLVAFMDPSCPNCANFHNQQRIKVSQAGYDVIYIPSTRNPQNKKVINSLVHFYCRKTGLLYSVQTLYSDYKRNKNKQAPPPSCSAVDKSYIVALTEIFTRHKFIGSPAFITPEGYVLYGFSELRMYIN